MTIQQYITKHNERKGAIALINTSLVRMCGLGSSDLPDSVTFMNGIDLIEDLLSEKDFDQAKIEANYVAQEMLSEEGFPFDE